MAFIAAERRELEGVLANAERVSRLDWPLDFAGMVWLNGRAALLVANGPGPKLAGEAVDVAKKYEELDGLVSTGFCGALNPALAPCDIFVATDVGQAFWPAAGFLAGFGNAGQKPGGSPEGLPHKNLVAQAFVPVLVGTKLPYKTGKLLSIDHVASTAAEKSELRKTGADAVEMEAAAVAARAAEWKVPFYAIRVVTDTAAEDFPLDFNRMRDSDGRFNRAKILGAALRRPGTVLPELMKLNKRCKCAAKALGDFIARSQF